MNAEPEPVSILRKPILCVWLALAAYVLAFAAFYPTVLTVSDETAYMRQAFALAHGHATLSEPDLATGAAREVWPSEYPPGTSLVLTPFMWGGWRAGFLLGAVCCVASTLLLAALLTRQGRSPFFALLFLAYPPVLVISHCGMSDLPTALCVTAGLYCFFRGDAVGWRLGAGLLAGATLLFRETAPLLFVFFFAGSVLRRERNVWALVVGGLGGVALRFAASALIFGNALFMKQSYPGFSLTALGSNAGLYALALLIFVPGGIVLAALYRGSRRPELLLTLGAFVLLHLLYEYNANASGGLKQLVLGPRFFIPLLPVLILGMAESVPRLWQKLTLKLGVEGRVSANRAARFAAAGFTLAVAAEAALCGYMLSQWQSNQRAIVNAMYAATETTTPVVTNLDATRKFMHELYDHEFGPRQVEGFAELNEVRLDALLNRHGRVTVALLIRHDSEDWRLKAEDQQRRLESFGSRFEVSNMGRSEFASGEVLEIYSITRR